MTPDLGGVKADNLCTHAVWSLTTLQTRGISLAMQIYKIFRSSEWDLLQAEGVTSGAPVDIADGYIHFSTAKQAAETAAKHFAGEDGLWLLAVDAGALGSDLTWEPSRGGALFPHLYRALRRNDVLWAQQLPLANGEHVFPAEME